jgi:hypothetical protein
MPHLDPVDAVRPASGHLERPGERNAQRPAARHQPTEVEVPERGDAVAEADGFEEGVRSHEP